MPKYRNLHEWRKLIDDCMSLAKTASDCFEIPADTLAGILAKRDQAEKELADSGEGLTVEHVNTQGAVYIEQNPRVRLINDLNRDALTYMRELGITPKGLKQITEQAWKEPKKDTLTELLEQLELDSFGPEEETPEEETTEG